MNIETKQVKYNILRVNSDNTDIEFSISGLLSGFAHSIGNFLRMVAYSYSPGYKPVAYSLTGITHILMKSDRYLESEDRISLNISEIRVKPNLNINAFILKSRQINSDSEVKLGDLDAYDLQGNKIDVTFINPDLYLFKTNLMSDSELEILVEFGMGFMEADSLVEDSNQLSQIYKRMLRLDTEFCSTELVTFKVLEDSPISGLDTLIFRLRTNGTMSSTTIMAIITTMMMEHLSPLKDLHRIDWVTIDPARSYAGDSAMIWGDQEGVSSYLDNSGNVDIDVEKLNITPKTYNYLKINNINNIRELRVRNEKGDLVFEEDVKEELIRELKEIGFSNVLKKEDRDQ